MEANLRFMKACRREEPDCTPVWFMRQAGRYMKEYREIRGKYTLLEMFKTADLAVQVTLQPLRAINVDAAIIFADILLPLEAMGIPLEFVEERGPVLGKPVRDRAAVEALRIPDPEEDLGYVLEALRRVRAEVDGKKAVIGFGGAPFTLASYLIEGGSSRSYSLTKSFMYTDPQTWTQLMDRLTETLSRFLLAQHSAGAQVVQLFDSWVGCLSPADYRQYVRPHMTRLFDALKTAKVPAIHFGTGNADLLPLMRAAGGDIIGIDWRTDLDVAWTRVGPGVGVQGNLDPLLLMAPRGLLESRTRDILDRAAGRPGHIFNLGHGILPSTPVDAVKALADFVHEQTVR